MPGLIGIWASEPETARITTERREFYGFGVTEHHPSVTVIMAVLDEAPFIDACMGSLADQDYPGSVEIVIADGGSIDGTRDLLASWVPRLPLTVIGNPGRRQAFGLNLAARVATGEILVRSDGHAVLAPDYVSASIRALEASGAQAVGGALRPVGRTRFGRAVAAAMRSPFATGPGRFHRSSAAGDVDTVYLGAFRREDFSALGGYRAFPSGAGEDADLYHRMRRRGWRIHLDPSIRSEYRPRHDIGALARQHWRYGRAKAEMLWANRALPSLRPLAPALLIGALSTAMALIPAVGWFPFALVGGAWLAMLLAAGSRSPALIASVVMAAMVMHLGYGMGWWWGVLRGPGPVRRALAGSDRVP